MDGVSSLPVQPFQLDGSVDALADRLRSTDPKEARKVAREFESMFVSLVLKEMRQSLGPGALFGGDNSDIYGGMFDQFMSQHLVDAGGFGVAKMVEKYLAGREMTGSPAKLPETP